MARIKIIWERSGDLTVWRKEVEIDQGRAQSDEDLFAFISERFENWGCSRFCLYLDHAGIDTRIERAPPLSRKLRDQLLDARLKQSNPDQVRAWSAEKIATTQGFETYRLTSLPREIGGWLSQWAQKNGVYLEGIFSLPISLSKKLAHENKLVLASLSNTAYVLAFDGNSNFLYHNAINRIPGDQSFNQADLESAIKRLQLFLEQEFECDIEKLQVVTATSEELHRAIMARPTITSSLLGRSDSLRLKFKRYRQRLFPAMLVTLLIVLNLSLPKYQERYLLEHQLSEARYAQAEIKQQLTTLRQANTQQGLLNSGVELGLRAKDGSSLKLPIASVIRVVSHFLGNDIELDSIESHLQTNPNRASITMTGRAVDTTVKLVEVLSRFETSLNEQGWALNKFDTEFINSSSDGGFSGFARLGKNRKFRLTIELLPPN